MESRPLRLLITTFPDEESAASAARTLLEERLIACGTLLPGARSLYLWKEGIEESREILVLMKTAGDLAHRCMGRLEELHPYDVPEIVLVDPSAVSGAYAGWVTESLSRAG